MTHGAPTLATTGAVPAAPLSTNGLRRGCVRLCALAELSDADHRAWQALGAQTADDGSANIFAQPWVVIAGLRAVGADAVRLALVNTADGQLIGVAPLDRATRLGRFPLPHWQIWNHPNSFCAPVLFATGHGQLFWETLLDSLAVAPESRGACALLIPECPADSAISVTLAACARGHGHQIGVEQDYRRALASADAAPLASYWDAHVRAKKRKELRRQAARLAELGAVSIEELAPDAGAAEWIDEFLELEKAGWKGREGSALAASTGTTAYFRDVVNAAHERGRLSFLAMRLDGRAIAMLVTLFDGDAAFSFKTAYDETLARFSPGVQIQQANLATLGERGVRWADSCAAADHPMIDSLWAERRQIQTLTIGLPGHGNRLRFSAYLAMQRLWRSVKTLRTGRNSPAPSTSISDD